MSITDELREEVRGFGLYVYAVPQTERLTAIADRIDAEHERMLGDWDYWESTHVELPKDADGEYIHIGDVMETENFGVVEVEGFIHKAIAFSVYDPQPARICTVPASQCRHYHAPTVEDVLREFTDAILEWSGKSGTVAEVGTWSDVAAEYASKLQLREDA